MYNLYQNHNLNIIKTPKSIRKFVITVMIHNVEVMIWNSLN